MTKHSSTQEWTPTGLIILLYYPAGINQYLTTGTQRTCTKIKTDIPVYPD